MAVYKKRDKTAKQIRKERSKIESESTTKEVFEGLDTTAGKAEAWILKHQNRILTVMGVIVVGVIGYMLYLKYILGPKEIEAADELAYPRAYYEQALTAQQQKDSLFLLALNGGEGHDGLLGIAERYSGTNAANLAHYYAGMAYLKLGEFKNAVEHLDAFDSDDPLLNAEAYGAMGDAFAELGGDYMKDALEYYEKAVRSSDNSLTTPYYLKKAGMMALELKQNAKAAGYFNRIKEEYNTTDYAKDIDFYINLAKAG